MSLLNQITQPLKLAIAVIIAISISGLGAQANESATQLPDLGSPDLVIYDQSTEERLGRAFTASLHKNFKLNHDPAVNHYIRQLGHRVAGYTGNDRHYAFYVIDNDSINAFAGPNGVIGIHTGLIKSVRSEDELAAVIAHEIAHVTQNHLSRRYEYASTEGNIKSFATLLAAILIGSQDANAGAAALMGGISFNIQEQLKNSRVHEAEADAIGIQLLHKSGYNPHAMGHFFDYLAKQSGSNGIKVPEILRTHPISQRRLAEAENRAQQLTYTPNQSHTDDFNLVRNRLIGATQPLANGDVFKKTPAKLQCYQSLYSQPTSVSSPCLKQFIFNLKASPMYFSQYIKYYQTQTKTKAVNNKITQHANLLLELYPNNPELVLNYAQFLNQLGKQQTSIQLLKKHLTFTQYQYPLHQHLAEEYGKTNKQGYAYIHLAFANMEIGHIQRGKHYLDQAKKLTNEAKPELNNLIFLFENKFDKLLINIEK